MSTHTPGPWLIARNAKTAGTFHIWRNDSGGKGEGNEGYAHIAKHVHGEANAQLIAAAPELLEALHIMRQVFEDSEAMELFVKSGVTVRQIVQTAIARAEGGL
jgi:hypothetical protein